MQGFFYDCYFILIIPFGILKHLCHTTRITPKESVHLSFRVVTKPLPKAHTFSTRKCRLAAPLHYINHHFHNKTIAPKQDKPKYGS